MADKKISALTAASTPLAGTEVLPIVQSGSTVKVSVANLTDGRSFNASGMTLTSTDAGATAAPLLDLYRDSASPAASDTLGEIRFNGEDSAGNKQAYGLIHGSILSPTSTAEQGQLHFETATAGALTEKMIIGTTNLVINEPGGIFNVRIEGDTDPNLFYTDATNDRVGIGTSAPGTILDVRTAAGSGPFLTLVNTSATANTNVIETGYTLNNANTGSSMVAVIGATNPFAIGNTYGDIYFKTQNPTTGLVEQVRIDSAGDITAKTGNLIIGTAAKGINFSANTHAAGMTSELLNWYEEGTWTPALAFSSGSVTYLNQVGTYTRIGKQVTLNFWIRINATSIPLGATSVTGLPFASGATSSRPAAALRVNGVVLIGYCVGWLGTSTSSISLTDIQSGTSVNLDGSAFAAASEIGGSITYLIL